MKENIIKLIDEFGAIGADPNGGVSRFLYTEEWSEAQNKLKKYMDDDGFETCFDDIGNLFGKIAGTKYPNETVFTGSHIDTVRCGGMLDGQMGILLGYVAIKELSNKHGAPLRNLELVSFAEEEGSRFPTTFWGSKNFCSIADSKDIVKDIKDPNGIIFRDAMTKAGFKFNTKDKMRDDGFAFVEIHIEQGKVLEIEKTNIGIVNNIVGQRRYTITLEGEANHAGTTPMKYRRDVMHALSIIVASIMAKAKEYGEPLVATVGNATLKPNISNTVPGFACFSLDVRHTEKDMIARFSDEAEAIIKKVAKDFDIQSDINMYLDSEPVKLSDKITNIIKSVCEDKKVSYKIMHSGAGHDSQIVAPFMDTAMIFIPSIKGISHNPSEKSYEEDIIRGYEVLVETLYKLAYQD